MKHFEGGQNQAQTVEKGDIHSERTKHRMRRAGAMAFLTLSLLSTTEGAQATGDTTSMVTLAENPVAESARDIGLIDDFFSEQGLPPVDYVVQSAQKRDAGDMRYNAITRTITWNSYQLDTMAGKVSQDDPASIARRAWVYGHEAFHGLQREALLGDDLHGLEQEADCGAAVFVRWMHERRILDASRQTVDVLAQSSKVWGWSELYGPTRDSRSEAITRGYEQGTLAACDAYAPQTTISVSTAVAPSRNQ